VESLVFKYFRDFSKVHGKGTLFICWGPNQGEGLICVVKPTKGWEGEVIGIFCY